MASLKESFEKIYGSISDSNFWRLKKLLTQNDIVVNRESIKTLAVLKKNHNNLTCLVYMKNWKELSNILPTKKSELVTLLKSKHVPYQTYHNWLKNVNNGYLNKSQISTIVVKLINWSKKKNGKQQCEFRSLSSEKNGN
jgi:hypothetical protein